MQDHDIQRLRHGITKIKDHYGSWKRFADELEKFSNGKAKIDRRTLERICGKNWKSVQLKIEQLLLLDRFFVLHNEEPLLMKDLTIVDTICESPGRASSWHPSIRRIVATTRSRQRTSSHSSTCRKPESAGSECRSSR